MGPRKSGSSRKFLLVYFETRREYFSYTLSGGDKVTLVGFGTFQVMEKKARRGVNPQTRETI